MPCLRGDDPSDRTAADRPVDDLREARAERLAGLVRADRNECALHVAREEVVGGRELRPRPIGECRLVRVHPRRAAPGENEAEERRHGACSAPKSLLPPDFSTSRSDSMTMPCESALHMS